MIGINPAIPTPETKPNMTEIPKSVIASAAWHSRKKNCHCAGGVGFLRDARNRLGNPLR